MTEPRRRPVFVVEEAFASVLALAEAASPFETGGIIVGVRTVDSVWITGFVEVDVATRHRARFVIPAGATHPAIDRLRHEDARLGYLGDWHSHTANIGPSAIDFSTLQDLALGSTGQRRMLGLVRRVCGAWAVELWALNRLRRPRLADYEMTGPVPST